MKRYIEPLALVTLLVFVVGAKAVLAYLALDNPAKAFGPDDPDGWLRLVLVREWIQGGGWYNHAVPGTNTPFGGVVSPWTRPLDVIIMLLVKLQAWSAAALDIKLLRAALGLPVLWSVLLLLGLCRAARRVCDLPATMLVMVVFFTASPLIWNYFGTANADHHAPLAVLWVWALGSIIDPRPRDGWLAGGLFGLMLWVSPEALLPIAAVMLGLGLRWAIHGGGLELLWRICVSLTLLVVFALLVEVAPGAWMVPVYDSLSVVHVFLCALCALLVMGLMRVQASRSIRFAAAAMGGIGLIAIMWCVYPLFFRGPMAEVDPFILTDFMPAITEVDTVASLPLLDRVAYIFVWIVALLLLELATRKATIIRNFEVIPLFTVLVVMGLVFLYQLRWMYYVQTAALVVIAPWVAVLYSPERAQGVLPERWLTERLRARLPLVRSMVLFALALTPMLLMLAKSGVTSAHSRQISRCEGQARLWIQHGALKALFGPEVKRVWLGTNLGTQLLFFTPYEIIASNYHREGEGIRYAWAVYAMTGAEEVRAHLARRDIEAMVLCPDARQKKSSYLRRLYEQKEEVPAWLEEKKVPGKIKKYSPRLFLVR